MAECFIMRNSSLKDNKNLSKKMGYVFNNLMCHYSADNEHFQTGWRIDDLSGNGNVGLFISITNNQQPEYLTNSGNFINLKNRCIIMPEFNYKTITAEIVCSLTQTSSKEIILMANAEQGGWSINYNSDGNAKFYPNFNIDGTYYHTTDGMDNDFTIHLFSATYDTHKLKFYIDGIFFSELKVEGNLTNPKLNTITTINANPSGGNAPTGQGEYGSGFGTGSLNFYSSRIYNRALSDDEIMQNFLIDKKIFL